MKVERLNLDNDQIEEVESLGIVQFIGEDNNADLTNGKTYHVIGFHQNLLKIIDDSKDYYYYLPFDADDIGKKIGIVSGFYIREDKTGKITQLVKDYKVEFDMQEKKAAKKWSHRIIEWKLKRDEKKGQK